MYDDMRKITCVNNGPVQVATRSVPGFLWDARARGMSRVRLGPNKVSDKTRTLIAIEHPSQDRTMDTGIGFRVY
jgi:hypothetical protein